VQRSLGFYSTTTFPGLEQSRLVGSEAATNFRLRAPRPSDKFLSLTEPDENGPTIDPRGLPLWLTLVSPLLVLARHTFSRK
jgi:hypothetical protein